MTKAIHSSTTAKYTSPRNIVAMLRGILRAYLSQQELKGLEELGQHTCGGRRFNKIDSVAMPTAADLLF